MLYAQVFDRLTNLSRDRRSASCPAHDDPSPSLSIGYGRDGQLLLYCFAGCHLEAIVAALKLRVSDLFPPDGRSYRVDDETHEIALRMLRAQQRRRMAGQGANEDADCWRVIHHARRVATQLGPEHPEVWDLLAAAAELELLMLNTTPEATL